MNTTTKNSTAGIEFCFAWNSEHGSHTDCQYVQDVNFWRDIFPGVFYDKLMNQPAGAEISHVFKPGDLAPRHDDALVLNLKNDRLDRALHRRARYGRFYPSGLLKGVAGVFSVNREPFRCVQSNRRGIHADMNHPLAGREISVRVVVDSIQSKSSERGGPCMALEDLTLNGPGMQSRANGRPTDFFSDRWFERDDERDDAEFYTRPRLVNHLDDMAMRVLTGMHGRLIPPGSRTLDLMGGWKSHLPDGLELDSLTGLGMNSAELEENPRLTSRVRHDLNANPSLPFDDAWFDAVMCTASVEYLTRPFDVFSDVARVLKPGGLFVVSFSNRWFPPKAVRIWSELHEFERMGLASECFMRSGRFRDLHTWSMRGKPRPHDDKYFGLNNRLSDPVYMVWASKNES